MKVEENDIDHLQKKLIRQFSFLQVKGQKEIKIIFEHFKEIYQSLRIGIA